MMTVDASRRGSALALLSCLILVSPLAAAGDAPTARGPGVAPGPAHGPSFVLPGPLDISLLYASGELVEIASEERWRFVCGSNTSQVSEQQLREYAARHELAMQTGPITVIDNTVTDAGLNLVFNAHSSVPQEALVGLAAGEAFFESIFADNVTVTISVSFEDMGNGGVIGATGSSFVSNVSYTNSRNGLQNGKDSNDFIQDWLPAGSTVPVRYDGNGDTITNETRVNWTRANYKATVGSSNGGDASMTFNTRFPFDYNPGNGVMGNSMSFIDVLIHEVGHALGFVSSSDWGGAPTSLDLYRFQRTDGSGDYNPDTYEEFQVRPRLVDFNTPDDAHMGDLIDFEYRMSDGDPYQASHFREQGGASWIGIMDPAFGYGETHYPEYFSAADYNIFDAMGWDYPACVVPLFTKEPEGQTVCGDHQTAEFSVAVNIPNVEYQWRRGAEELVDDGTHIVGAQTATLTIIGVTLEDVSTQYNCVVTNSADGCQSITENVGLGLKYPPTITQDPEDQSANEYDTVVFEVRGTSDEPITYQWRKDGVPLTNDGHFYFVDQPALWILEVRPEDAGTYDCVLSNASCGGAASAPAVLTVIPSAVLGDLNCDGETNFGDIGPFVLALSDPAAYAAQFPGCPLENRDINGDGAFDFGDITPFVALLSQR